MAIEGLLNDGTSSFVEAFGFPSFDSSSRSRSQSPSQRTDLGVNQPGLALSNGMLEAPGPSMDPFAGSWIDPYAEVMVFGFPDDYIDFEANSVPSVETDFQFDVIEEVENGSSQRIRSAIEGKIREAGLEEHEDLFRCSELLFSGNNVSVLISQYFATFHHACPIMHEASFDRHNVPFRLLMIMSLLGAMYLKNRRKKVAARQLLDVAELIMFDTEIFSMEAQIKKHIGADVQHTAVAEQEYTWLEFQELQASYLMVEAQYWSGSRSSRRRAVESRFGSIVYVCSCSLCFRSVATHYVSVCCLSAHTYAR